MKISLQIIILIFFASFNSSLAQYSINEEIIDYTVLIDLGNEGSGSGLFYQDSGFIYVITAKHVLIGNKKLSNGTFYQELKNSNGLLKFYSREPDKTFANEITCDFSKLILDGNLRFSATDDVLVLRIGKVDFEKYNIISYVKGIGRTGNSSSLKAYGADFIANSTIRNLGDDVFILGYPKALGLKESVEFDFNRPLLRKGALAGHNSKNNTHIIDCPSYGGNSGGPVILVSHDKRVRLIGIVVSFIPFAENWANLNYGFMQQQIHNSGYSVVEPIEKALDLISKMRS